MSDNIPRLTGGILFGLILDARKTRSRVRSTPVDKADGLTEVDVMQSFLEIFTGESQERPQGNTFNKNVSDYKKCLVSNTAYLPFDDQTFINSFDVSVQQNKKDTLESMSVFINEKLLPQKLEWLVTAVIETICADETIDKSERFTVSKHNTISKSDLSHITEVEIELFLLDVMKYIFVNKIDNTLGKSTFEAWYSQNGPNTTWRLDNPELGTSFNRLEIIRYSPSLEEPVKLTDDRGKQEHIEETDSGIENEFSSNVESNDSITRQVLHNHKGMNQYANNIYNIEQQQNADRIYIIEQANNVNNIVNHAPTRNNLPPTEYYNLFILNGEKYENKSFILRNERIFEYTTTAIKNKFSSFTHEDIDEIISLPTLFLPEYNKYDQNIKKGFLGRLVDIDKTDGNGISRFYFQKEKVIDLESLVTFKSELMIEEWELSRTHWAIKRANIQSIVGNIVD